MKSTHELRERIRAALRRYALLLPAAGVGCAATVSPYSDGGADVRRPDTGPMSDTAVVDVLTPPDIVSVDVPVTPTCPMPSRALRECMTMEQAEFRIRNPPGEFPRDAAVDAGPITVPRDPSNGCYVPSGVQSGCCNPAMSVMREGDRCCYLWCEQACCGRPFVVDGEARFASLESSSAWCEPVGACPDLDPVTREAVASAWRRDAQFEHASIASFSAFVLDAMSVGAPPDILRAAQRAALDEIDHALLCFGIAAAVDGAVLGAGAMPTRGATRGASIEDVVRAAVFEGCVGETIASVMARAQHDVATVPAAREALDRIARDEAAHAELAWSFVAWAVRNGGRPVRDVARAAFDRALASSHDVPRMPAGVDAGAWAAYGRLTEAQAIHAVNSARAEVIGPCASAVLGAEAETPRIEGRASA